MRRDHLLHLQLANNCTKYSTETIQRAKDAQVQVLPTDASLVRECDVILSVVPPRDAEATARRVADALAAGARGVQRQEKGEPLYFVELNAVAPSTSRTIAALFDEAARLGEARFLDGAIIGGPPAPVAAAGTGSTSSETPQEWRVPLVPTSGPHQLSDAPHFGAALSSALNVRHVGPDVGRASGLKMCFASLSKGQTAIAVQAFATASRLGVLDELRAAMGSEQVARIDRSLVAVPPKAYRFVREMEEIARTHREEGGFGGDMFGGAAEVYRAVAEDTVLGREKVGQRKRGLTAEDVAAAVAEGLERKRKKLD